MAEPAHPQGWQVPQRTPAIAAAALLAVMLVLLLIAGWAYKRTIATQRHRVVSTFPAPGLETYVHDGTRDPARPRPRPSPDPAIEGAKRSVLATGLAGWGR